MLLIFLFLFYLNINFNIQLLEKLAFTQQQEGQRSGFWSSDGGVLHAKW